MFVQDSRLMDLLSTVFRRREGAFQRVVVRLLVKYMRQKIGRMGLLGLIGHRLAQEEKLRLLIRLVVLAT